eukprot:COSAG01_NODE_2123_length_8372_cov_13.773843_2_plen_182_part_00
MYTSTQRYLQPPLVVPMCVSGHYAPQLLSSCVIIRGAYDMCLFWGRVAWLQSGDVDLSYVLLVCRKVWFLWAVVAAGETGDQPGARGPRRQVEVPPGDARDGRCCGEWHCGARPRKTARCALRPRPGDAQPRRARRAQRPGARMARRESVSQTMAIYRQYHTVDDGDTAAGTASRRVSNIA